VIDPRIVPARLVGMRTCFSLWRHRKTISTGGRVPGIDRKTRSSSAGVEDANGCRGSEHQFAAAGRHQDGPRAARRPRVGPARDIRSRSCASSPRPGPGYGEEESRRCRGGAQGIGITGSMPNCVHGQTGIPLLEITNKNTRGRFTRCVASPAADGQPIRWAGSRRRDWIANGFWRGTRSSWSRHSCFFAFVVVYPGQIVTKLGRGITYKASAGLVMGAYRRNRSK